jgi:hypothetical protein
MARMIDLFDGALPVLSAASLFCKHGEVWIDDACARRISTGKPFFHLLLQLIAIARAIR